MDALLPVIHTATGEDAIASACGTGAHEPTAVTYITHRIRKSCTVSRRIARELKLSHDSTGT